ncbi:prophage DNA circulation protein [Labrenzia sp. EL_195]|nr:prophage DNA circulation protein [Labrenzia sp. EL_195]
MAKFAEIKNGVVVTVSFDPMTGWPEVADTVFPGDTDNGDGTFSRPAVAKYTLDSAKAMIVAYAEAFETHVSGNVSIGEKLSWTVKEAAAVAHLAGTATADQTAMLQAEASQTGETLTDLSNAILSNATAFRQIAGSIAGLRRATKAALEAESDPLNYTTILQSAQASADALATSLNLTPMSWDV